MVIIADFGVTIQVRSERLHSKKNYKRSLPVKNRFREVVSQTWDSPFLIAEFDYKGLNRIFFTDGSPG